MKTYAKYHSTHYIPCRNFLQKLALFLIHAAFLQVASNVHSNQRQAKLPSQAVFFLSCFLALQLSPTGHSSAETPWSQPFPRRDYSSIAISAGGGEKGVVHEEVLNGRMEGVWSQGSGGMPGSNWVDERVLRIPRIVGLIIGEKKGEDV